jgi:hypothetical protein
MITKQSPTRWEYSYESGEGSSYLDVTATEDGIDIDGEVIPWSDLRDAVAKIRGLGLQPHIDALEEHW